MVPYEDDGIAIVVSVLVLVLVLVLGFLGEGRCEACHCK